MAADTFKGAGWSAGILVGWLLERRFVGLTTEVPVALKLTRATVGMLGYYAISLIVVPLVKIWIAESVGVALASFLQVLYVTFTFPWLIVRTERRTVVAQPL